MKTKYPLIPLREVVTPVSRPQKPIPGIQYRQIGVRLWGKGAYEREMLDGARTKYKTLNEVQTGDLIINKIWARNGSVAVVPDKLSGCLGSNEFPTFKANKDSILSSWIGLLTQTRYFWDQCDLKSRGTSGKNRIKPEKFLEILIPLPPIAEQRRIVKRIDVLAAKIEEARRLKAEAIEEAESLCRSILFGKSAGKSVPTKLKELVEWKRPNVEVDPLTDYQFAGVYCFGRGVFKGQIKKGTQFAYKKLSRLKSGQFTYPKLMAWEGAFGVVPSECNGCCVSPEFPVFEINKKLLLPETLDTYFKTPSIWAEIAGASTGTNVRRRRLNPKDFLEYEFPLPSMEIQKKLQVVRNKLNSMVGMREQTQTELDALIPSVLDRAFKGEL